MHFIILEIINKVLNLYVMMPDFLNIKRKNFNFYDYINFHKPYFYFYNAFVVKNVINVILQHQVNDIFSKSVEL